MGTGGAKQALFDFKPVYLMRGVLYYGKHVMTYDIIDITRNAIGRSVVTVRWMIFTVGKIS